MNQRIKKLREEKNFTQEYLARQIGTTQTVLSKIECGISIPDAILVVKLANIFQVSTDYILGLSSFRTSVDVLLLNNVHSLRFHLQKFLESIHHL